MDQPPASYQGRQVVIIGGGVSGSALAIHLLANAPRHVRVVLVERRQWLGRGPAYGTTDPGLRLNVQADRMSLFPDRPLDFVEWAQGQGADVPPTALLPRQLFGEYVEDRLASAVETGAGKVWVYRTEAVAASEAGVQLADGTLLPAAAVVLATGNQLPAAPACIGPELRRSKRIIGDPWNANALRTIEPDEEVLVLGTGLTAVDVLLALRSEEHRGRVVAVSRRGLLPRPHLAAGDPRRRPLSLDPSRLPKKARELSGWLRREARRLEGEGVAWQCLVDALRPITTQVWEGLDPREKARFMRRLRPYWEVVRHRAPAEALATLEAWRSKGTLDIVTGALSSVADEDDGLHVTLTSNRGVERRRFDRIVLCVGPETDVRRWTSLLFRQLLRDRLLMPDPLALGLVTDPRGRTVCPDGSSVPWLFTLGGLRRPHLWETTSVPDIVQQARALASVLLETRVS
jgi:uncharacterized NAD(P)/FAD-binding protein YdhS